jgi:hypothetical protein
MQSLHYSCWEKVHIDWFDSTSKMPSQHRGQHRPRCDLSGASNSEMKSVLQVKWHHSTKVEHRPRCDLSGASTSEMKSGRKKWWTIRRSLPKATRAGRHKRE